ncbi:MAG: single-stranded-DNA-specific exonuclease RecJ [Geitlerinemataceae cyanobacterium]
MAIQTNWKLAPVVELPDWFVAELKHCTSHSSKYLAKLLWQRGIRDRSRLPGFLDPNCYQPSSPFEFGEEMYWAVERLQQAREQQENVAIWGDFDADGITATAVLWDGLGEFFPRPQHLQYTIPNRLTESHGLNISGIDRLAKDGVQLIVTCDTGSTNLAEIEYAQKQGIDIIITDHHTLLDTRPPVTAIVNPRSLSPEHPLYHLSGVAVAYKLIEALYQTLPEVPQKPLENLLDLVAIGLIADLVELKGDCRYLAQVGIQKLQQQLTNPTRPGVAKLLELCKRTGDRPTDISFGIGPRINAVSRIQGDASFCVELLTRRDPQQCHPLAQETELANTRRQSLQRDVARLVRDKLSQLDLSTTNVIVLTDPQWQVGVLGLVASQISRDYDRPTILLSTGLLNPGDAETELAQFPTSQSPMARGSARSVEGVDLYQLVKSQSHLLDRFGGHPLAAGLSLPVENIPLFTEGINRQLGQQIEAENLQLGQVIQADLRVTVSELGQELFQELKLIEPCGMGNPVPKLLIENCWFKDIRNRNLKDYKGRTVKYIKTEFKIGDDSETQGFDGVWWGHYKDEIPSDRCDAIVELDFNAYHRRYEVRLIAVSPHQVAEEIQTSEKFSGDILDWRRQNSSTNDRVRELPILKQSPSSWEELQTWVKYTGNQNPIALGYPPPESISPEQIWQQSIGIAKYFSRTGKSVTRQQLCEKLGIGDRALQRGLQALQALGFETIEVEDSLQFRYNEISKKKPVQADDDRAIYLFIDAIREEQFRRQYFSQVSISTIQLMANPF